MSTEITLISPEGLKVAEAYIANGQDIGRTATHLNLPVAEVERLLNKRETRAYVDRLFLESGFRNRDKIGSLIDEIINHKLEELADTQMGSGKDILEILQFAHKLRMDEMAMQIKMMEIENKAPTLQINQQINNHGSNYNSLLEKLLAKR